MLISWMRLIASDCQPAKQFFDSVAYWAVWHWKKSFKASASFLVGCNLTSSAAHPTILCMQSCQQYKIYFQGTSWRQIQISQTQMSCAFMPKKKSTTKNNKQFISTSTLGILLACCEGKASFEREKVLLWCTFWSGTRWLREWQSCLGALSASPSWGPDGLSMVQECAEAMPAPADRTPLRSPAAARMKRIVWVDTQWQELMRSSTSVTAFISYTTAIDSLAGVTLLTLSFNLLQRAWPVEHISRGAREQTLGCPGPNGN